MPRPWNKGLTKFTSKSLQKTSKTMRSKKIDNFSNWRKKMLLLGKIGGEKEFIKNGNLAELIGMTLGDGSIHKYARTEGLRIVLPTDKPLLIKRYLGIVEKVFNKKPTFTKRKTSNCIDIRIYQKNISKRLGIKDGARALSKIVVPKWIVDNKVFMIRYLRGLYEAEGSFSFHKKTYTHKLQFSNQNKSMLTNVFNLMKKLDFHPHKTPKQVQISKKREVHEAMKLLRFRKY